jgi:ribosomal protein S18 acetylase RimI-like enzyme
MIACTVRLAEHLDAEAALALARDFATSFVVDSTAFSESFSTLLADPHACLLVAEQAGQVVGYLLGFEHLSFYANGPVAWVEEITVSTYHRRRGIGRLLMQGFEGWAATRGARLVALATRRAASFYQALGYEELASYFRKLLVE